MISINEFLFESKTVLNYRPRVEVVIIRDNNILLTKIPPYPPKVTESYYGFPGGGIDNYENPIIAAEREVLEEVGIKLENIRRININPFIFEWDKLKTSDFTADKYKRRMNQYKGTITNYFIADYAGIDKSIFDIDKDALKYDFYTIDIAINKMKKQYENFPDEKQKPIFEYRLKVLNIIKEKYL